MDKNKLNNAAQFALTAHGDQMYGPYRYSYHLSKVVHTAFTYGGSTLTQVASWLHDTIEDTDVTKEDVAYEFGDEVAHIVDLVSNRPTKEETCERIRTNSDAVFVKLCDRLANVTEGEKNDKYRKAHPLFKSVLYREGEFDALWTAIDKALEV